MQGVCHVVAAGSSEGFNLALAPGDFVIAADGGYRTAIEAGIEPDLFVGDYDSLSPELVDSISCDRVELPCAKDKTDTLVALEEGMKRGYTEFHIHAALGGDVGHEIACVQCLHYLREQGAFGFLHGHGQTVFILDENNGTFKLHEEPGTRLSVFSFASAAVGVEEHGTQWELSGAVLKPGDSIGVSNKIVEDEVTLSVASGALLVVVG